jgi:hypothetical protein
VGELSYTTNAYRLKQFLDRIPTRLVDFAILGDSNTLHGGSGWDMGISSMVFEYLNGWSWGPSSPSSMYATGLHAFGEGGGTNAEGSGLGWGLGADGSTSQVIRHLSSGGTKVGGFEGDEDPSGISGFWHSALDPGPTGSPSTRNPMRECVWLSTSNPATNPGGNLGMMLQPQNPLGIGKITNGELQYQLWAAKWTTADAPSLGPVTFFRLRHPSGSAGGELLSGGSEDADGIYSFTTHGAASSTVDTEAPFVITVPVDGSRADTDGLAFRWNGTASSAASYPFAGFFQRVVLKNREYGFAVSALYSCGGADVWDCMNYVTNVQGQTPIQNYFKCLTKHQRSKSQDPMVVVPIAFGMNDWGGTPMTAANHKTYMKQLMTAIRTAWTANGYTSRNLLFVLIPSHPPDAGDSIQPYREVCSQLAREYIDVCCLDLLDVTTYATLNSNLTGGTYPSHAGTVGSPDRSHLKTGDTANNSYRELGKLLASGVVDPSVPTPTVTPSKQAVVAAVLLE